jgi:hypothetical protein
MKLAAILIVGGLFVIACKSLAPQSETKRQAQAWFDSSFTKCGEDYFAKYAQPVQGMGGLYVNKYGAEVQSAIFEFKHLSLMFEDQPVTETEKLNGVEAKGHGFVQYSQFRYHDGTKWSYWEDVPLIFSGKMMQSLNKLTERPNSPMYIGLEKNRDGWSGKSTIWQQVSCSELPSL